MLQNAGTIECGEDVNLRAEVFNILVCPDAAIGQFDEDFVEKIIGAAPAEDAIKLLIRMIPTWEENRVMRNLKAIGPPYGKIADYGKKPKITESKVNNDLVVALKERDIISQFKKEDHGIRIITKRKDPSE